MAVDGWVKACACLVAVSLSIAAVTAADSPGVTPKQLLATGKSLADNTHYLEALDLFDEARSLVVQEGQIQTELHADILYALAATKIKGRLHQDFPAYYVKAALDEIQDANRIRERLAGVLPQKMAEGYYLEGLIHKRFFMRNEQAVSCFVKAVNIDPGSVAAKRELSELVTPDEK